MCFGSIFIQHNCVTPFLTIGYAAIFLSLTLSCTYRHTSTRIHCATTPAEYSSTEYRCYINYIISIVHKVQKYSVLSIPCIFVVIFFIVSVCVCVFTYVRPMDVRSRPLKSVRRSLPHATRIRLHAMLPISRVRDTFTYFSRILGFLLVKTLNLYL